MTALSFQTADQLQPTPPEPTFPGIPSFETLTERLLAYDFPSGFAERLAGEEGWTLAFALKVLGEYRRFLVLAATADQSVTPSRAVDAAWHLHLTYTRDYWLRLIPLLPAALHHDPSGNLAEEAEYFAQQYRETLMLYYARFGEPDPLIWPDPLNRTDAASPAPPRTGTNHPRSQRWLTLLVLWVVGGAALTRFGIWAVVGLIGLGFVLLLAQRARQSTQRPRSTPPASSDGDSFLGFSSFLAGFGDGGCDSGSSDSGGCSSDGGGGDGGSSGCGSGCGGGCGS